MCKSKMGEGAGGREVTRGISSMLEGRGGMMRELGGGGGGQGEGKGEQWNMNICRTYKCFYLLQARETESSSHHGGGYIFVQYFFMSVSSCWRQKSKRNLALLRTKEGA